MSASLNRFILAASAGVMTLAFAQVSKAQNAVDSTYALIPEAPSSVFIDATATHVPIALTLHASDCVLIDVDHDGDLDAVFSVEAGVNRLYVNTGGGRMSYRPGVFGTTMHDSEHVRAADFDRDGNMDVVFVAEDDHVHQLFLGDGLGGFKDVSDRLPARSQANGLDVGDVNGDGLADIFIGSTGGENTSAAFTPAQNLLFLNDPSNPGHFIDASRTHLPQGDDQIESVVLADMDRDGDLDAVLGSPSHPNRLLINDGMGRFADASERLELQTPLETRQALVFDADGDGRNDVLFLNITSNNRGWEKDPRARLLLQGADGRFRDQTEGRIPAHTFSSYAGTVVDFDGDGDKDLLISAIQVPGSVPLQLRAWRNDGKGTFADATLDIVPGGTVGRSWNMAQGDLDGDGKPDVLIGGWRSQVRLLLTDRAAYRRTLPPIPRIAPPAPSR